MHATDAGVSVSVTARTLFCLDGYVVLLGHYQSLPPCYITAFLVPSCTCRSGRFVFAASGSSETSEAHFIDMKGVSQEII